MERLVTIAEAEALASGLKPSGTETVPPELTAGRVLAAPLRADRDLPPYPRAMMDGIAFAAAGVPADRRFTLAGLHAAGDPPPGEIPPGHAWEIMTGACVPPGCDTVVPYEDLTDGRVLKDGFTPGQFVHAAGSDARAGDLLVPAGTRIGPVEAAIAASVGAVEVPVFRRPRVAILSTGDEAVPADSVPEAWQIRRSNGPMIAGLLQRRGIVPVFHEHAPDDPERCGGSIARALAGCDLLLVCGGISKGKKDFIRPLLEARLGAPLFHGVAQRPGKPLAFWAGPPAVFALPGNPVSVLATFTRHVQPLLDRMEGTECRTLSVVPGGEIRPLPAFGWLLTVSPGPDGTLHPRPPANSGDFISVAGSTGIIEIPPRPAFTAGAPLRYFPFPS